MTTGRNVKQQLEELLKAQPYVVISLEKVLSLAEELREAMLKHVKQHKCSLAEVSCALMQAYMETVSMLLLDSFKQRGHEGLNRGGVQG